MFDKFTIGHLTSREKSFSHCYIQDLKNKCTDINDNMIKISDTNEHPFISAQIEPLKKKKNDKK